MQGGQSREWQRPLKAFLLCVTIGVSLQLCLLPALALGGLIAAQELPPSPTPKGLSLRDPRGSLRGDTLPSQPPFAANEDLEKTLKIFADGKQSEGPLGTALGFPQRMQSPVPQQDLWRDTSETQVQQETKTLDGRFSEEEETLEGREEERETNPGKPLFISHANPSGLSLASVVRAVDLTLLGEEENFDAAAFNATASCGGLFLNSNVQGYAPNKGCIWNYWAQRLHAMHPRLLFALHRPRRTALGLNGLYLGLVSKLSFVSKALPFANNALFSLCWLVARRATRELRRQQQRGEELNIGRAINEVFRTHSELVEPMQTAFYLLSGKGCNANIPYTDRAREGFGGSFPDLKKCPMNPLLQHYANHPEESLAWVPPAIPKRFSVTISQELPPEQQHEEWRLPLYRLWHLLWFQIFEAYRLDHLWNWLAPLDTRHIFPGWEVKAVGVVLLTEHRPATYADGVWRFANIHPDTLELARHPDGSFKDPFEFRASGTHHPEQQLVRSVRKPRGLGGSVLKPLLAKAKRYASARLRRNASSSSADTENSSKEEKCGNIQVLHEENSVRFFRCGKELRIYKSICGSVPTFNFISQSPFAVLLSPLKETRHSGDTWEPPQHRPHHGGLRVRETEAETETETAAARQEETAEEKNNRATHKRKQRTEKETLKAMGWTVADAVWAFRPSTSTKVWLINRMVSPLKREPLLSAHPEAKMAAGHRLFFARALRALMDEFLLALQAAAASSSTNSSGTSSSSSSSDYEEIAETFARRSESRPFTIVFSGLSIGGATAEIAAIYFARELKRMGLDNAVRIACIAFGAPSWGTPAMYASFDELGIIWNEIVSAQDPVPELLAGEDILGLAHDRRQISLRTSELGTVGFLSPFPFEGSAWLKGTAQTKLWWQVLVWLFGVRELFALPHNPHIAHQHVYSAALSLISGAYKYSGWMSHLAVPWLPNIQITTVPDAMHMLEKVHAEHFGAWSL